jgi:hypothetical protein
MAKDFRDYVQDAVRDRAVQEGIARLRSSMLVAAIGPLALLAFGLLEYRPGETLRWLTLAMAPLAVVLLGINYLRLPGRAKLSGRAFLISLVTLAFAGATLPLARLYSLL